MVNSAPSTAIPNDVVIRSEARKPVTDPTLGIPVSVNRTGTPRHRLVTLGDSLTQGFQSGAIFNTGLSYPMLIAEALGWKPSFRYPTYNSPGDGLPLIKVMELAGVKFYGSTGSTPLPSPVKLDFNRLIPLDTLISKPPRTVASMLDRISFLDSTFNLVSSLITSSY